MECFSDLKSYEKAYFAEDTLNLSEIDRLLFLSHFEAIGKMWNELSVLYNQKFDALTTKYKLTLLEQEDGVYLFEVVFDASVVRYVSIDTMGEVIDTDISLVAKEDENGKNYSNKLKKIATKFGELFADLNERLETFCKCLGYEFEWDFDMFSLDGHGIITRGSYWCDHPDDLFENMEPSIS